MCNLKNFGRSKLRKIQSECGPVNRGNRANTVWQWLRESARPTCWPECPCARDPARKWCHAVRCVTDRRDMNRPRWLADCLAAAASHSVASTLDGRQAVQCMTLGSQPALLCPWEAYPVVHLWLCPTHNPTGKCQTQTCPLVADHESKQQQYWLLILMKI